MALIPLKRLPSSVQSQESDIFEIKDICGVCLLPIEDCTEKNLQPMVAEIKKLLLEIFDLFFDNKNNWEICLSCVAIIKSTAEFRAKAKRCYEMLRYGIPEVSECSSIDTDSASQEVIKIEEENPVIKIEDTPSWYCEDITEEEAREFDEFFESQSANCVKEEVPDEPIAEEDLLLEFKVEEPEDTEEPMNLKTEIVKVEKSSETPLVPNKTKQPRKYAPIKLSTQKMICCNRVYAYSSFYHHKRRVHREMVKRRICFCNICGLKCKDQWALQDHKEIHKNSKEPVVMAPNRLNYAPKVDKDGYVLCCGEVYKGSSFRSHKFLVHPDMLKKMNNLHCLICHKKIKDRSEMSRHHKQEHPEGLGGASKTCLICGHLAKTEYGVLRHKRSFHPELFET